MVTIIFVSVLVNWFCLAMGMTLTNFYSLRYPSCLLFLLRVSGYIRMTKRQVRKSGPCTQSQATYVGASLFHWCPICSVKWFTNLPCLTVGISFAVAIPFIAEALNVNSLTNLWKILQNAGVKLALAVLTSSEERGLLKRLNGARRCLKDTSLTRNFLMFCAPYPRRTTRTIRLGKILGNLHIHWTTRTVILKSIGPQVESNRFRKRLNPLDKNFVPRQGEASGERWMKKVTRQCRIFFSMRAEGDFLDNDETEAALKRMRCNRRGLAPRST